MADHERNFRTQYYHYEKFGKATEEKKSLEVLLSEDPIGKEKLGNFCCRCGLPAMYRNYVWKLLLGVLPLHSGNQEFVWNQRKELVRDMERAFILLSYDSDVSVPQKMLKMKLIEEGCLPLQDKVLESEAKNQYYLSIVRAMNGLVTSDVDLYWMSTRFFHFISEFVYPSLPMYPTYAIQCLKLEDQDQRLFQHLSNHLVLNALPFSEWFHICFSNILPESSLELIWDRVIGGCSTILIYVAVAIMLVLKRPLMAMHTTQDMLNILKKIPEDCGDKIVNEAMELHLKYGGRELEKLRKDSPAPLDPPDSSNSNSNSSSRPNSGSSLIRSKATNHVS